MKTIKVKSSAEIPKNYTGIVEMENGYKIYYFNDLKLHREDGPAKIWKNEYKEWWLNGCPIWSIGWLEVDLRDKIILSKEPHPKYPTVQILKYISQHGIKEQIMIPGMEEYITE